MRFFVGTSGYGYKEWKGSFYPLKMKPAEMLGFYAQHFSAVEINQTFRRMPTDDAVEAWTAQVPATFQFVLKAPQKITHFKRLKGVESETAEFLRVAATLKKQQGPLLFQLPPNFKQDVPRLEAFLKLIGKQARAAFEFRHESWFEESVFECLRKYSCCLCVADAEDLPATDLVRTADWGYVRLRREDYDDRSLSRWIATMRDQGWDDAYVFFRHEETGLGPKFGARFMELSARPPGGRKSGGR
jgi:uncharacterized protein YecE (DUF72 family)